MQQSVSIVAIGKLKQNARYLQAGIDLYQDRLSRDLKITWVELPEEAPTATRTVAQILEKEADAILRHVKPGVCMVVLSERGQGLTSEAWATWWSATNPLLGGRGSGSPSPMLFVIGSAFGLSQRVLDRADMVLSLSSMTFPHQMVRLMLMEQLYRAVSILQNTPYHK